MNKLLTGPRDTRGLLDQPWVLALLLIALSLVVTLRIARGTGSSSAHASPHFEDLDHDTQTMVKEKYRDLLAAHERHDFNRMLDDTQVILGYLNDFNDTKSYDAIARRGLADLGDSQRREEERARHAEVRRRHERELASLEVEGASLVRLAAGDAGKRAGLYHVIDQIKALDPSDTFPDDWLKRLHQGP